MNLVTPNRASGEEPAVASTTPWARVLPASAYPGRSVTAFPPLPGNFAFSPPPNISSKLPYA